MRGRGRGRGGRSGGSNGPKSARELLGDTMEDVGMKAGELENESNALFPPMQLPSAVPLSDLDASLIQRQREFLHRVESALEAEGNENGSILTKVYVTTPASTEAGMFIPEELESNASRTIPVATLRANEAKNLLKPNAFDRTFKNLEKKEDLTDEKDRASDLDDAVEEMDDDMGDDNNDYVFDYYDSDNNMSDDGNDLGDIM